MSVSLRGMEQADIPTCKRLSNQVGWNQTAADWARLIAWEPLGCFVAEQAGEVVATVTTTTYESRLAWVGMMLVDTTLRRQGIGRISVARLLRCARNDRPKRPCGEPSDEAITNSYFMYAPQRDKNWSTPVFRRIFIPALDSQPAFFRTP